MKVHIKNMICKRCIFVVEKQLKELQLNPVSVTLGEVDFGNIDLSKEQLNTLKFNLEGFGFELLDDKTSQLIEKIKLFLLEYVFEHLTDIKKIKISDFLRQKINYDYNYVSNLFSATVGVTIEHYLIQLKIEKVKEYLFYNELTLSEIADKMGYSSVAHLSGQFKKETGVTPTNFKNVKNVAKRNSLDELTGLSE